MALATVSAALLGALLAAVAVAGTFYLRRKNRQIWHKLGHLEAEIERQRDALVTMRKEQCLISMGELRLTPLMPSQHGEDLVLWRFFNGRRKGFFVEIGAYDGVTFSNTYLLEAAGWSGILVEPNPERFDACVKARPHSRCMQAAIVAEPRQRAVRLTVPMGEGGLDTLAFTEASTEHRQRVARATNETREIETPALTIDEVLDGHTGPIDLVSVDVEGAELAALQGMDIRRWAPELFVIEDNSMGRDRLVTDHLARFGYVERLRLAANVFYSRAEDDRPLVSALG